MKIKQKKQLTLPQLIEWAWDNGIRDRVFHTTKDKRGLFYQVSFSEEGAFYADDELSYDDIFIVEVEEEIREDTRLDKLVVRYRNDDIYIFPQERIDDFKNDSSIVAFYIPNDDLTLTLIWRDGKMIE